MRYIGIIVIILLTQQIAVFGQEDNVVGEVTTDNIILQTLTLSDLTRYIDQSLNSPYDTLRYRFSLPPTWQLNDELLGQLRLNSILDVQSPTISLLQIYFNNVYIDTVAITGYGLEIIDFIVPLTALDSLPTMGEHELYLIFDSQQDCEQNSLVILDNDSNFSFSYVEIPAILDISQLPRPIFDGSFNQQPALVVIPDDASSAILETVLITFATFSDMSNERLSMSLINESELTPELRATHHLMLIGLIDKLPLLSEIEAILSSASLTEDVGILQLFSNPFNAQLSTLIISGRSELGLKGAVYALSYGDIVPFDTPNVAIIENTNPEVKTSVISNISTFNNLGYSTKTIYGPRSTTESIFFNVTNATLLDDNTSLQLVLSYSQLIDYSTSGISIKLNNEPVGSVRLNEDASDYSIYEINLPNSSIISGINEISIDMNIQVTDNCINSNSSQYWINIYGESTITLPISETPSASQSYTSLSEFPSPFNFSPSLNTTHFILDSDDRGTWQAGARLAYYLGQRSFGRGIEFAVSFASEVSTENLAESNLIILSNNQENPVLVQLNEALAEQNINLLDIELEQVTYRLSDDSERAYIQFLTSPWNEAFSVLSIQSDTDQGHDNAVNALITSEIRRNLVGNFALLRDRQIISNNIQFTSTNIENLGVVISSERSESLVIDNSNRLLIFAVMASLLIIIIGLIWGVMRFFRS